MNLHRISLTLLFAAAVGWLSACSSSPGSAPTTEAAPVAEAAPAPDLSTIKNQYILQAGLFEKATVGISDEEANRRISDNTNSLIWIAGHMLDIQYNLAALLGITTENPYAEQFAFGKPFDPQADYPSLSTMQSDWDALTPKITQTLGEMTEEQLAAEPPFAIPFPEQSIRGLLGFQMHHLGYEIGQIGLYRKFLGKEAMSYQ